MITALAKAFAQLADPRLRRVVAFGIVSAAAAYAGLVAVAWWALGRTTWFGGGWEDKAGHLAAALLALLLPLPFFPALATALMSVRLEAVAEAVDERHYPALNWPRPQKWAEILATTLRFLGVTALVNLAALPLYAVLIFTGLAAVPALAVNGYLLGREYYEVVAFRRLPPAEARLLFRNRLGRYWLAGTVIAVLFGIPLLNLTAPVVATAFMLHLLHSEPHQALQPHAHEV